MAEGGDKTEGEMKEILLDAQELLVKWEKANPLKKQNWSDRQSSLNDSWSECRPTIFKSLLQSSFAVLEDVICQKCMCEVAVLRCQECSTTTDAVIKNLKGEELLKHYFDLGLSYSEIWAFLAFAHGIHFSMRHVRRRLNSMGLYRRKHKSSAREVIAAISSELTGSANCIGYRLMHQRLRNDHHLVIDRETVRLALKVMDPDGVAERKKHRLKRRKYFSPGPNFLWHIDGYDKLKAYGFAIHGCIDGYSRRIMWLEVRSTNNDAAVIADHFLGCVCLMKGTARIVRADPGTKNVKVEVLQKFFRANGRDSFSGDKSFMYGKSTANQRIEAWWAYLRHSDMDWWINFFKDLRDSGDFKDYNQVHIECLRFCFMRVIQAELDQVAQHWNLHRICSQHNVESPPGRPDTLFFLLELEGTLSYLHPVSESDLKAGETCCSSRRKDLVCLPEFADVALELMAAHKLVHGQTPAQAKELFLVLTRLLENLL